MALDTFNPYLFVSAGEQSNKFLTPTYADGIAQFQAQRAQSLAGLTVRIDPIQEGTGDPSLTNIRPISGRTGLTVTRAGKNLAIPGYNTETVIAGLTITPTTNGVRVRGTATKRWVIDLFSVAEGYRHIPLAEGTKVTISLYKNGDISTAENPFVGYYVNGAYSGGVGTLSGSNNYTLTWTVPEKYADAYDSYLRSYTYIPSGATVDFEIGLQIEIGASATAYEPYTGTSIPITWESIAGTVYGGTLDVVSGVLTVDRGFAELSEDWAWRKSSAYPGGYIVNRDVVPGTAKLSMPFVCSHAKTVTRTADYVFGTCYCDSSMNFRIMGESSTLQDWKDYIAAQRTAGTPVQICYYLATPQTYQLTPTEVRTIAGFNQIYSDAGPVIDIKF